MTVLRPRDVLPPPHTPKSLNSPSNANHNSTPSQPNGIQPPPLPSSSSPADSVADSGDLSGSIFSFRISRRRSRRFVVKKLGDDQSDVNCLVKEIKAETIDDRELGIASDGILGVGSICSGIHGLDFNEGIEGLRESLGSAGSKSDKVNINGKRKLNLAMRSPADDEFLESKNCLGLRAGKRVSKAVKEEIGLDISTPQDNVDGLVEERRGLRDYDNHPIDLNVNLGVVMEEIKEDCSRIDDNDCIESIRKRFSRKEKGKWIVDDQSSNGNRTIVSPSERNNEVCNDNPVELKHQNNQFVSEKPKGIVIEESKGKLADANSNDGGYIDPNGYTALEGEAMEKNGVGELVAEALLTLSEQFIGDPTLRYEYNSIEDDVSGIAHLSDDGSLSDERQEVESSSEEEVLENVVAAPAQWRNLPEDHYLRRRSAGFARCPNEDGSSSQNVKAEGEDDVKDWPGPFYTAMKIARDRANDKSSEENDPAPVEWIPKKTKCQNHSQVLPPSLRDLCLWVLAKNADAISSLEFVPDTFRNKLSQLLCDSRKMNSHFLNLLLCDSPTEVCLRDCSWLSEEEFEKSFQGCDTNKLMMLQLDQCGRCILDYVMLSTLARSSNSLPALMSLSLSGACRLSDVGIAALVSSAPALQSLNLSQCSFLTFSSIDTIADSLGSTLRELYLDDCLRIDPVLMIPAMKKLQHLEVLSLAGIENVCDRFILEFLTDGGQNLKELSLANCVKLTDKSIQAISENCSALRSIDLVNLSKLTDFGLCCLATGCPAIQKLKLSRNLFSDEAVAAFLEISRENLKELSLNNVKMVSRCTAVSLACFSKNLVNLDLSWCRKLTNEALGLIVDNCPSLKVLKLFGCSQVTDVFLDGHTNAEVEIIGLKLSPVWPNVERPNSFQGIKIQQ